MSLLHPCSMPGAGSTTGSALCTTPPRFLCVARTVSGYSVWRPCIALRSSSPRRWCCAGCSKFRGPCARNWTCPQSGVGVEVLDDTGERCAAGVEGNVWVGSRTSFGGYTDGTDRARHRGLVGTGDIGAWDEAGRLRVLGRADDVIISGGENVHPEEAERVLRRHPEVADVAVVGAPDPVLGQVVVAHVVRRVPAPAEQRQDAAVAAQ